MLRLKRGKTGGILALMAMLAAVLISCGPDSGTAGGAAQTEVQAGTETEAVSQGGRGDDENSLGQTGQEAGIPISVYNDTVELGTLAVFEPSDNIDANSGVAIAGSDEEQLQQERIAGGAVGDVVSENLEPLHGITDYSEGEYVIMYGVDGE